MPRRWRPMTPGAQPMSRRCGGAPKQSRARRRKTYLKSRGVWPLPAAADKALRWLPNAREGALVAAITDDVGALVAIQLTHITPEGEKSRMQPVRLTIRGPHDWRSRGAFRLGAPDAGPGADGRRRGRAVGDRGRGRLRSRESRRERARSRRIADRGQDRDRRPRRRSARISGLRRARPRRRAAARAGAQRPGDAAGRAVLAGREGPQRPVADRHRSRPPSAE